MSFIELSIVIGVIALLASGTLWASSQWGKWSKMKKAEAIVTQIDAARSSYLIDNPQLGYSDIAGTELDPYLPTPYATLMSDLSALGYSLSNLNQPKMRVTGADMPAVTGPAVE